MLLKVNFWALRPYVSHFPRHIKHSQLNKKERWTLERKIFRYYWTHHPFPTNLWPHWEEHRQKTHSPIYLSSDHPSLPFVHISWSWIIPFSLPRLSLFVSLSSLLSPASSSSLLSFLNPNAVSSSKCCWINHKESMNPCVFGDFLPCFWCHKGGSVIGKCTSTHRIARLQLYLWFGR